MLIVIFSVSIAHCKDGELPEKPVVAEQSNDTHQQPIRPRRPSREEIEKLMDPNYSHDAYGIHDPVMIKEGKYYYVFSTNGGIKITRSQDMKNFERIGQVFTRLPEWMPTNIKGINSLWAPDISCHNGTFYLYYSASSFGSRNSLIGLITNQTLNPDSPEYKWVDQGVVVKSSNDMNYNAIDPNLTFDQDNNYYLTFGSFWSGIKMIKINTNGLPRDNNETPISLCERPNHAVEAPYIIYHNGYYFLFVSFDLCCKGANSTYKIMVGRAKDITGPYIDKDNIPMTEGGGSLILSASKGDRWKGPGHNAIFSENGKDYLIYHAYDSNIFYGPSALHIRDLLWDKDNWPYAGEEICITK